MLTWKSLTDMAQVDTIREEESYHVPCLIFKHSTRCSISTTAKARLERTWQLAPHHVHTYYLDLLNHRPISNHIVETFGVQHESPQVLLIIKGECVYDESHNAISANDILTEVQQNN
ncbi:MAG TPA: bacillithiol system redox-active protein YtxJ [Chitinophagales bacterium]|nr:bacillithiol system redox-active protein YtxJ [Chitinophagales bacterium]